MAFLNYTIGGFFLSLSVFNGSVHFTRVLGGSKRAFFLTQFTVFFGCFACENMKGADKVAVVVESAELSGFGNGLAAI